MARAPYVSTVIIYVVIALAIALFVRFFIAAPYLVSGASMDPTFRTWNYLIIDQVSYHIEPPQRGDIVVFRFPQDPSKTFIKRIIGLPEETVALSGNEITIRNNEHPDGFVLDEPYVIDTNRRASDGTTELGENEYFVLGDNRKDSADSRMWGALSDEHIIGRAFLRLFPLSSIDIAPGEARYRPAETPSL